MAGINPDHFSEMVQDTCSKSKIVMRIVLISESRRHVRLRIFLSNLSFIDVYYKQTTGKTAFAHIQKDERIFGADNTEGSWHWHPYHDPNFHERAEAEVSFDEFLRQVEQKINQQ